MMQKKCRLPVLLLAAALSLGGCGTTTQSMQKTEGLDALGVVQVISREEGSGTRSAFAQLVGFDGSTAEGKPDGTTDTAQIAVSAQEVIAQVRSNLNAVGYISMGSLTGLDREKVLDVNHAAGTLANLKGGDYPLSRPFCLAWIGTLSDLEQDFLTYVTGKGQTIVSQSYVPAKNSTTFLSGQQTGTITIHGSTSAAPLLQELAAEYMSINPHATIVVTASDSTTGLNDAMQGICDFGMASRELKDYEKELLTYQVIAQDGIAVIVNAQNPLSDVTIEELKGIFTGSIVSWDDINTGRK